MEIDSKSESAAADTDEILRDKAYESGEFRESLRVACAANGLTKTQFVRKGHTIERIECFQEKFFRLESCRWFTGLRELWILSMSCVETLSGLAGCPNLEILTVSNCKLSGLAGLEKCTRLKRLHLQGNAISSLRGLRDCVKLETLWVDDNDIRVLEG